MGKRQKAGKGTVIALEREREGVAMRITGATYQAIGDKLGMTRDGAFKAVMRGLKKSADETARTGAELREIEVKRLDAMVTALWKKVEAGDEKATETMLRVMKRRAMMLGLDAPKQSDLTIGGDLEVKAPQIMKLGKVTIEF